jgi:hypothetical protein
MELFYNNRFIIIALRWEAETDVTAASVSVALI